MVWNESESINPETGEHDQLIEHFELYEKIKEGQMINNPGNVNIGGVFDPLYISPFTDYGEVSGFTPTLVLQPEVDDYVITEQ